MALQSISISNDNIDFGSINKQLLVLNNYYASLSDTLNSIKSSVNETQQKLEEEVAEALDKINDIQGELDEFAGIMDGITADGIIDAAEKIAIRQSLEVFDVQVEQFVNETRDVLNQMYDETTPLLDDAKYTFNNTRYDIISEGLLQQVIVATDSIGTRTALELYTGQLDYFSSNIPETQTIWYHYQLAVNNLVYTDEDLSTPDTEINSHLFSVYKQMHTVFTDHLAALKNVMVVAHERINERYKELIKSEFEETYKELRQDISDVEHELSDATNKMNEFTSTIGKALEDGILTKAEIININRLKDQLESEVRQLSDEADDLLHQKYVNENNSLIDDNCDKKFKQLVINKTVHEIKEGVVNTTIEYTEGKEEEGLKTALVNTLNYFYVEDPLADTYNDTVWTIYNNTIELLMTVDMNVTTIDNVEFNSALKDNYDLMESQVYFMLNRLRAIIAVAKIYIQENYDRKINGVSDALQEELLSMAADNIISVVEKTQLRKEIETLKQDYDYSIQQASNVGLTQAQHSEVQNYMIAFNDLSTYLREECHIYSSSTNTEIDVTKYTQTFEKYYSADKILDACINYKKTTNITNEFYNEALEHIEALKTDLTSQIDGVIDSYFIEGIPTNNNYPAIEWETTADKQKHVGDTFTNILSGNAEILSSSDIKKWFTSGYITAGNNQYYTAAANFASNNDEPSTSYITKCLLEFNKDIIIKKDNNTRVVYYIYNSNRQQVNSNEVLSEKPFESLSNSNYLYVAFQITKPDKVTKFSLDGFNLQIYLPNNDKLVNPDAGKSWRWCGGETINGVTSGYHWHEISDSDALAALRNAAAAQDTADGKRRVFTGDTIHTPYDIGDLWVRNIDQDGDGEQDIYVAIVQRANDEKFKEEDWEPASDSLRKANEALENLSAMADDNKISVQEKAQLRIEVANITKEYNNNSSLYNGVKSKPTVLTTAWNTYGSTKDALFKYLTDTIKYTEKSIHTFNSSTAKETFVNKFANYYNSLACFQKELINADANAYVDEKTAEIAAANAYLQQAIKGSTDIQGGLVLTNIIQLKDASDNVKCGLSGLEYIIDASGRYLNINTTTGEPQTVASKSQATKDNILLWGGGTYADAWKAQNTSLNLPVLITKSGVGSNIGPFEITSKSLIKMGKDISIHYKEGTGTISTESYIELPGIKIGGLIHPSKPISLTRNAINSVIGPFVVDSSKQISVGDIKIVGDPSASLARIELPGIQIGGTKDSSKLIWLKGSVKGGGTRIGAFNITDQGYVKIGNNITIGNSSIGMPGVQLGGDTIDASKAVCITGNGVGSKIGPFTISTPTSITLDSSKILIGNEAEKKTGVTTLAITNGGALSVYKWNSAKTAQVKELRLQADGLALYGSSRNVQYVLIDDLLPKLDNTIVKNSAYIGNEGFCTIGNSSQYMVRAAAHATTSELILRGLQKSGGTTASNVKLLNGAVYLQKSGLKELAEAFRSFMHTYFKDTCKKRGFSAALDAIVDAVPNSSYYLTTWYGTDKTADLASGDGHLDVVNSSFEKGKFANFDEMWDSEGYEQTETYTQQQKERFAALKYPHLSNLKEFDILKKEVNTNFTIAHQLISDVSTTTRQVFDWSSMSMLAVDQLYKDINDTVLPSIMTNIKTIAGATGTEVTPSPPLASSAYSSTLGSYSNIYNTTYGSYSNR